MADSYRNRAAENTSVIHIRAYRISGDTPTVIPSLMPPSNDLDDKRNDGGREVARWRNVYRAIRAEHALWRPSW